MNTRMTGGSVWDDCLKMMAHISIAKVIGAKLKQEMKIDMILESLPDSFSRFKMNYNMDKLKLTPVELMHELESAESKEVLIMMKVPQNLKGNLRVERRTRSRREQSEAFDKFREYKAEAEKQLGVHIEQLWSNRGGEYLSGEFKSYLAKRE
nr:uncharacterized protein LOC125419547 [Ziziphus jujuba var. spinosa]